MMIETPIAFGLTMVVCLVLFFYCWRVRKFRISLTSVQVSATSHEAAPLEEHSGMKKEVVEGFPTVKAHELKVDIKAEELQCPICLVEYGDEEVLRKLPVCGHVFHVRCVDSWLENQITCPVCRIVLTGADSKCEQSSNYCRGGAPSIPNSVIVDVAPGPGPGPMPAWVLVNRPMPLPPAIPESMTVENFSNSSSSGGSLESSISDNIERRPSDSLGSTGESRPLLVEPHTAGWGAVYLEKGPAGLGFRSRNLDIAIESRECVNHSTISQRWMTESFSFGTASSSIDNIIPSTTGVARGSGSLDSSVDGPNKPARNNTCESRALSWSSRSSVNSNQPTTKLHWRTDFGYSAELEVFESKVDTHHLPLTISPEHCSFEFLPIITGSGGDYSLRPATQSSERRQT